ncbi:MAG: BON domain-containing protein [Cyclobacteriaceae bacterium]
MKNNKDLLKDVQDALAKDVSFKNCLASIYVLINDGAVILAGSVDTAQLKNVVRKIVSAVPGVNLLIEDLKVESIPSHRLGVQIDWASGRMALTQ